MSISQNMQFILLVFALFVGAYASKTNNYENMMDSLSKIDGGDKIDFDADQSANSNVENDVVFWLHTRESDEDESGYRLIPGSTDKLRSSPYNSTEITKIIIHGWLGNSEDVQSLCAVFRKEYFEKELDYNIVCMDWRKISHDLTYVGARLRCKEIGYYVADLVTMLCDEMGQSLEQMHIIGFSMGAHIAGYAGKKLESRVGRITGLDPAWPLFPMKYPEHRLSLNDAKFVDVMHTSSSLYGQIQPLGVADFFPNGGHTRQPGCPFYDYLNGGVCSHFKAYENYARSIRSKDDFIAIRCDSWSKYLDNDCDNDDFTYMGEYTNHNVSGNYYLTVDEQLRGIF